MEFIGVLYHFPGTIYLSKVNKRSSDNFIVNFKCILILHLVLQCSFVDFEQVNPHWKRAPSQKLYRSQRYGSGLKSASLCINCREVLQFLGLRSRLFPVKLRISIYFCPRINYYQKQLQKVILVKYVMLRKLWSKPYNSTSGEIH